MRWRDTSYFDIGPGLTFIFAILVALILGGNAFLIWEFHLARAQTESLTGVNQRFIALLQLHDTLLSIHQRLDELARAKDAHRLVTEVETMRRRLLEQTEKARIIMRPLSDNRVGPAFASTLEAIEVAVPSQFEAISILAMSGDWEAVRLRLANDMRILEAETAVLVDNADKEVGTEQSQAISNMTKLQGRILIIVPATAIATFVTAAVLGWAVTKRIMVLRLEERLGERARIARELHDTLLQDFHGLLCKFQAARNLLPGRPQNAIAALDGAIKRAEQAIAEGRRAIEDLRSERVYRESLDQLLMSMGQELAGSRGSDSNSPAFRVVVEGERRNLRPALQDDLYGVGRELLRNAFRHANARHIEAEIRYYNHLFCLRVRDDGRGIDPTVLKEGGRAGHWGLPGIRERAGRIGARLDYWSEAGAGTEIELTIPAAVAYET